ncbi:MAG TPA: rRNA maturation RNase YbeY [Planctomycetes bacterium]|nr:rRNA maturation RNase YbeY [Planctomycetota bacterium]HIJ70092.1 rRNA maturation RNase YbeY [Planctomycetota bacterium]
MGTEQTDITVDITCNRRGLEFDFDRLEELARRVCRRFPLERAVIDIAIVGDEDIKKVNADFLDTAEPTDVISFDLSEEKELKSFEVIVNADEAQRQAEARGHSTEAELALYITHGLLHNLGFSDTEKNERRKMHSTEDEILQQAGFGIIYGK